MRVDTDLWMAALELAATRGWKPSGIQSGDGVDRDRLGYVVTRKQSVGEDDARGMARSLSKGLEEVPAQVLPLEDRPFGDAHTQNLLHRAAAGEAIAADEAMAAIQVLSGPPRRDAWALVEFLSQGAFSIRPATESALG